MAALEVFPPPITYIPLVMIMIRRVVGFLLIPLVIGGCSRPKTEPPSKRLRMAVVTDTGGIGDLSFNAMAWSGLQRAGKELGIDVKFLESKE